MNTDTLSWITLGTSIVALALNIYVYALNKRIAKEIRSRNER